MESLCLSVVGALIYASPGKVTQQIQPNSPPSITQLSSLLFQTLPKLITQHSLAIQWEEASCSPHLAYISGIW